MMLHVVSGVVVIEEQCLAFYLLCVGVLGLGRLLSKIGILAQTRPILDGLVHGEAILSHGLKR